MIKVRCAKMRDGAPFEAFFLRADNTYGPPIMIYADKDEARRAAGKQVGLRNTEVAAALQAMGACPGGVNEWTGVHGGILTRPLATEIVRLRHHATGDGAEPSDQEVASMVTMLNRDGKPGGAFDALVVSQGPQGRQWAVAPGPITRENDRG